MGYHSDTQLERIDFRDEHWRVIMAHNARVLNDALLYVSGMLDVDLTSLTDRDILKYNGTSAKFENVSYDSVFPSTTTTTSTTSSTASSTSTSSSTVTSSSSTTTTSLPLSDYRWNSADQGGDIAVSNNDRTITKINDTQVENIRSIGAFVGGTDKVYFEIYIDLKTTNNMSFGVMDALHTLTGSRPGNDGSAVGFSVLTAGGTVYYDGTSDNTLFSGLPSWDTGDVMMIAIDFTSGDIFIGKNGSWLDTMSGTPDPATGTNPLYTETELISGSYYIAGSIYNYTIPHTATVRTHPLEMDYSIPSGFSCPDEL